MGNFQKKLSAFNLSEIYQNYDTYIIDLWGVMHNGISLNSKAVEVVEKLNENSKRVVFLSNAPRPSLKVIEFLKKMKRVPQFCKKTFQNGCRNHGFVIFVL